MDESEIRAYFKRNWVFWLYVSQQKLAFWHIIILFPTSLFLIGAIAAVIFQAFYTYATNPVAYIGPIWIGLTLIGNRWFVINYPKTLEKLYPALDTSPENFKKVLLKWTNLLANRNNFVLLASGLFWTLFLIIAVQLRQNPPITWIADWVNTEGIQQVFFMTYYVFTYVFIIGFLFGTAIVGILGSIVLINDLLGLPIKLEYGRRLQHVTNLSIGVGLWGFLAVANILVTLVVLTRVLDSEMSVRSSAFANNLFASLFILSIITSGVLLIAFLFPIFPTKAALDKAKNRKLSIYEERLYEIAQGIEKLLREPLTPAPSTDSEVPEPTREEQLASLKKERENIKEEMKEIEGVQSWPITWVGISKIVSAAVLTPVLGVVTDVLLTRLQQMISP